MTMIVAAHYFIRITLVEAFVKDNNFDIVCFSEAFLDSTVSTMMKTF